MGRPLKGVGKSEDLPEGIKVVFYVDMETTELFEDKKGNPRIGL